MNEAIPHQAIYRRWRAQTFSEIVGQEAVVATLRNAVLTGQVSHAILFTGPRGTGKTSLARILAKALNCTNLGASGDPCDACTSCVSIREGTTLDVVEMDAATNRGIDNIRDLRDRLAYPPGELRRKVYILDEAHQITAPAWNALLKSLEEPPEFALFMFASTHPQEFPPAILSRLQRFDVRRLTVGEIVGKLERILAADGREADPEAVRLVARLAAGGMRDAESILDQLLSSTGERIDAGAVRDLLGLADAELVDDYVTAIVGGEAAAGIVLLDRLEERGRDLRVFLDQVVDVIRERLLADMRAGSAADPALAAAARRLAAIDPSRLGAGGLRLQLELALLEPSTAGLPRAAASSAVSTPVGTSDSPPVLRPAARPRPASASVPGPAGRRDADEPVAVGPGDPAEAALPPASAAPAEPAPAPDAVAAPTSAPAGTRGARRTDAAEPPEPPEPEATQAIPFAAGKAAAPAPTTRATAAPGSVEPEAQARPAEAHAEPAEARPAEADAEPGDDLDRLRRGWPEIVALISRNPASKPLILDCRPISVEGNVVTLGFPEEKAFLKDVAARRGPVLEQAFGGFLGHPVGVRCVATNLDLLPPLPADTDAAQILAEAQRIFADDLADVPEVS